METKEIKLPEYIYKEKYNIKLDEVAGQEKVKEALKEFIINPDKIPTILENNQKPLKGILLYGPPGAGKTYLAKAVGTEFKGNFLTVYGPIIISKWNSQSKQEIIIKEIFDCAKKYKPAVIHLDEIDFITKANNENDNMNDTTRKMKQEFLNQMQNLKNNDEVMVLGIASKPWELDPLVRKCFQKKIYINLPELNARKKIFELYLKNNSHNLTNEQIEYLAKNTELFTCSDIYNLIQETIYEPIKKCQKVEYFKKIKGINGHEWNYIPCEQNDPYAIKMKMEEIKDPKEIIFPEVNFDDFKNVLGRTKPTMTIEEMKKYEKFEEEFGQEE